MLGRRHMSGSDGEPKQASQMAGTPKPPGHGPEVDLMADAPDLAALGGRDLRRLRLYNLAIGFVHLAQASALLWLSNDFSLPVTERYLTGPPGSDTFTDVDVLFELPLGPAVAAFLAISAADHFLMAAPRVFGWYVHNLRRRINYARWYEYAISASLMIVLIAMVTGITNVAALVAIFGVNATMLLFGLIMELHNREHQRVNWTAYVFGCFAGAVPWLVIGLQVFGTENEADVPTFVYGIFVSLFLLFNSFAVNMVLQYRRIGPWRNYVFGEYVYILLSLTAKTALAWQVFANTLID